MLMIITKKQHRKNERELIRFCKENHCLMYNYMRTIEQIRKEPEDKILMDKLRKQAKEYKKNKSNCSKV